MVVSVLGVLIVAAGFMLIVLGTLWALSHLEEPGLRSDAELFRSIDRHVRTVVGEIMSADGSKDDTGEKGA